ncbi:MAG: O-antigen ligase family protein [Sporomusaceae bacterium]|nr:O-antigen ligase family protein [Sporomusaceae bacterium]
MNKALLSQKNDDWLSRLLNTLIIAVVFFLPLSLDVATAFLAAGSLVWFGRMLFGRGEFGRLPFDNILILLLLLGLLSIAGSPDRFFSIYNYGHLMGRYVLLYYLVGHNVRSLDQIKRLLAALLASAVLVSVYGFYQYIFGVDISAFEWVDAQQFPDLKVRVFSTWQNPNLLAGFLVSIMAIVIGISLHLTAGEQRLSLLMLFLLLGGCLLLTYSRGAWLSLAVIVAAYGLLSDRRLMWLLLLIPVVMLCFGDVSERAASILHPTDTSSTLRLALWHSTLAMIRDNPLTGIGWGAYWLVYPHYDYFINDDKTIIFHAHNLYLHLAAETGIPGLAAFVAFMGCHARLAIRLLRQAVPPWIRGLLAGLTAAILGLIVSGLTDHILFSIQMSMLAWLLFAIVIAVRQAAVADNLKNSCAPRQEKGVVERNT